MQLLKHGSPPQHFVVEIPALNKHYLGSILGSTFKIKHVVNEPAPNLQNDNSQMEAIVKEGTEELAVTLFNRLQLETISAYQDQSPR
jgi:hypothetical protein